MSEKETYRDTMRSNLKQFIEEHTGQPMYLANLDCISTRQLYRVIHGQSDITVGRLEDIAKEIGVDFLTLFKPRK